MRINVQNRTLHSGAAIQTAALQSPPPRGPPERQNRTLQFNNISQITFYWSFFFAIYFVYYEKKYNGLTDINPQSVQRDKIYQLNSAKVIVIQDFIFYEKKNRFTKV